MKHFYLILLTILFQCKNANGQSNFNYNVELTAITTQGIPGLHSFVFAQSNGKWLIIGGRKDGIHARQPFNAFQQAQNNDSIYVLDINAKQYWSASLTNLPSALSEQLQSTNMNFHQINDTLYIVGGYAYSPTSANHITFPYLTTVHVSATIQAVINGGNMSGFFKQITDTAFAVTGGQLGAIGNTFLLVGGHKFTGRYNPMGNPTYTQSYTNQIRKFQIDNSGSQPVISNYSTVTDPVHLRRRDYNLLPQIFPNGSEGYTISSGVFQSTADLPFLYPVDITSNGHTPVTTFNQYLSNYHSAKVCLYDSINNVMHNLFFGGISQYYYENGSIVKDDNVPFVKTISRVTRLADGSLQEYQLPLSMPALKGSSAEFIINSNLPHYTSEVLKMSEFSNDTILIGHILGGIHSNSINAFTDNQTNNTNADNTIYAVYLIKGAGADVPVTEGKNPYNIEVFPNPASNNLNIRILNNQFKYADYYLTTTDGRVIMQGSFSARDIIKDIYSLPLDSNIPAQNMLLTIAFDNVHFVTQTFTKL